MCLSRNCCFSIHSVCVLLAPSSEPWGFCLFSAPNPGFSCWGKPAKIWSSVCRLPSSALELASLAFELEVEAVGVVVGVQGAGEARRHRGVTQAGLCLAPALLVTCGGKHGALRCLSRPEPPGGRGKSSVCRCLPSPACPHHQCHGIIAAGGTRAGFSQGMLSPVQYSLQVMCPSLELKLYGVVRGLHLPSLSLL